MQDSPQDFAVREAALRHAVSAVSAERASAERMRAGSAVAAQQIVECAEAFYDFLSGKSDAK